MFIDGVKTRCDTANECSFVNFLSLVEHKKVSDALQDPSWINARQEDLVQFKRNKVWYLVP